MNPDQFSTFSEVPLDPLFPSSTLIPPVLPAAASSSASSGSKRPLDADGDDVILPPPRPKPLLDGINDDDDFGSAKMFFGGNPVGLGVGGKADSNGDQTMSGTAGAEEAPRKRLRRGDGAGGQLEPGSGVASSSQSRVTSPADSVHSSSSAPGDVTSPAGDSLATLNMRDHLSRFKLDSGPSSSASSTYGGGGGTVADAKADPGLDAPTAGESKGKEEQMETTEEQQTVTENGDESSPVRQTGRLVRGKRPAPPAEQAATIDLRSPPTPQQPTPFATYKQAISPSHLPAPLPPFATTPAQPQPQPPRPTTMWAPPPPGPVLSVPVPPTLSRPNQQSPMSHAGFAPPPPPAATAAYAAPPDVEFQSFAEAVGNAFPREDMARAWFESGRDVPRAIDRLVNLQHARVQQEHQQRQMQAQLMMTSPGRFPQQGQQLPQQNFQVAAPRSNTILVYPSYSELIGGSTPPGGRRPQPLPQPAQYQQQGPPMGYPQGYSPANQAGKIVYQQQSPQQQQAQYLLQQQQFPTGYPNQGGYPRPIAIQPSPRLAGSPHHQQHYQQQGSSSGSGAKRFPGPVLTHQQRVAQSLAMPASGPKKKKRNGNMSDSDDGGEYSEGSGDEYGGPSAAAMARAETHALAWFNECSKEDMSELAGCNPTQATLVIKLRPFTSTEDFRTRTRKQKGVGNQLLDNYIEVVQGMNEVDKVLDECEEIGNQLSRIMDIWAGGDTTAKVPEASGASTPTTGTGGDVGIAIVTISEDELEKKVKASQDPEVISAFSNYLRKQPDAIPEGIVLKDYQMLGLNWLNLLYQRKTSCILADEMGLGKTAQVIALMAHLKAKGEKGPHLVIVPSSTLENWMREFSVFAPNLIVESYYGTQGERAEIRHELRAMEELDVVVTTYHIATSSIDDQKFLKKKLNFQMAIFDEGHQLKNSQSKKYKDLMQIKTKWRCLLTGTPLQNNLQELVSLLSFILPDQFRDANESLRAIFKTGPGSQVNMLSRQRISRAKKMMTPFVLRRKKAQVLKDLPKKTEQIEWCEMTPLQVEVYQEALTRSKKALLDVGEEELEALVEVGGEEDEEKPKKQKKEAKSTTKTGNKSDLSSGSNVLMDLRKASNHPMLFRRLYTDKMLKAMSKDCLKELEFTDRDKDLILEDMEVMTDFELHRFCGGYKHLKKYCLKKDEWMSAGKIQTLQRLLPELKANGDRVLLFSQFTQVLDILEVVLNTLEIKYLKLTGQTAVTERQGLVDEYSNDPDITVFLLSTRAGGLGLNLTTANTVIFYDQDYNPHNDKQAEDRSYRIGQVRDVSIIKLITKGSLDEDMYQLGKNKLLLDSSVSSTAPDPEVADEGDTGQAEKKMRTSLLSNLKKKFEGEISSTQPATGAKKGSPQK